LGKASIKAVWTTHITAQASFYALNGRVVFAVPKGECYMEGVKFAGDEALLLCSKDSDVQVIDHYITNKVDITTKSSGLKPHLPVVDFIRTNDKLAHFKDNTVFGDIESVLRTKSPLDLLPIINLIGQIPVLEASYEFFKGLGDPAAIIAAVLSKYASATLSFEVSKSTTHTEHATVVKSTIETKRCSIEGRDVLVSANMNCAEQAEVIARNFKYMGSQDVLVQETSSSKQGIDFTLSATGISAGISAGESESSTRKEVSNPSSMRSNKIILRVSEKLEIENAHIDGEVVDIEAAVTEIRQKLNSESSTSTSDSIGMGVHISWAGGILPYNSFSHAEKVKRSQLVDTISGITGQNVTIVTKHLIGNVAAITASRELKLVAEQITDTPMPEAINKDKELRLDASLAPRADGRISGSAGVYIRDGDFAASVGWNSGFSEGFDKLQKFVTAAGESAKDTPPPKEQALKEASFSPPPEPQDKEPKNQSVKEEPIYYEKKGLLEKAAGKTKAKMEVQPTKSISGEGILLEAADSLGEVCGLSTQAVDILKQSVHSKASLATSKPSGSQNDVVQALYNAGSFLSKNFNLQDGASSLAVRAVTEIVVEEAVSLGILAPVVAEGVVIVFVVYAVYKIGQAGFDRLNQEEDAESRFAPHPVTDSNTQHTPIPKEQDKKILHTPIPKPGDDSNITPIPVSDKNDGLEGLSSHEGSTQLPGFEVYEGDGYTTFYYKQLAPGEYDQALSNEGVEYKPAPYHHENSRGWKSPPPKNPVESLLGSKPVSGNTDRRINVDKENNELNIFDLTEKDSNTGKITYHGHAVKWDKLKQPLKEEFIRSGMVKRNGDII
jgi:filamentous hemagglutinin